MKDEKKRLITPGYIFTFVLVTALFFLWSWPNTLNDFLITQFRKSLELSIAQTGFLPFALKTGYFCLAIPAGLYMQRKGYKAGIMLGLFLFAAGCLLFYPAASTQRYLLFLCGIFIMAGGCAFLEIGANSFVVSLGDKNTAERRLNLAQSFNPIGNIMASTVATLFIFSGNEPDAVETARMKATTLSNGVNEYQAFLQAENFRVFPVYIALAAVVLTVSFFIRLAKFPDVEATTAAAASSSSATVSVVSSSGCSRNRWRAIVSQLRDFASQLRTLFRYPHWWGAIISQFFYLAAQLGTWSYLVLYITQNSDCGEKIAGGFVIANMILFMTGRFFATWLMKYFKPSRLMGVYALINLVLVSVVVLGSRWGEARFGLGLNSITLTAPFTVLRVPVSVFALILTAFFMSLMYPTNFASGVKGLGSNAKLGASILVMSLIGGAIGSLVISKLAGTSFGLASGVGGVGGEHQIAAGMCVIAVSYCVIAWYAFCGSRPRVPLLSVLLVATFSMSGCKSSGALPAGFVEAADMSSPLPQPSLSVGETSVKVHLLGYRPGSDDSTAYLFSYRFFPRASQLEMEASVDAHGVATFRFEQYGAQLSVVQAAEQEIAIMTDAGEKADVYIDISTLSSNDTLSDERERTRASFYTGGKYKAVNQALNASLEAYRFEQVAAIRETLNELEALTPLHYTGSLRSKYAKCAARIEQSDLSPVEKAILTIDNKLSLHYAVLSGERALETAARISGKTSPSGGGVAQFTVSDYDILKDYPIEGYNYLYSPLFAVMYDKYFADSVNLERITGKSEGLLFDLKQTHLLASKVDSREALSESEQQLLAGISNPFYTRALTSLAELRRKEYDEAMQRAGFVVRPTPQTSNEELFAAIMSNYKGKVALVDFWATWCAPCLNAIRMTEPLKNDVLKNDSLVFVYITGPSSPQNTWLQMLPEVKGEHYRLDERQWAYVCSQFGITGIPSYVLLKSSGEYMLRNDFRNHNAMVETLLNEIAALR